MFSHFCGFYFQVVSWFKSGLLLVVRRLCRVNPRSFSAQNWPSTVLFNSLPTTFDVVWALPDTSLANPYCISGVSHSIRKVSMVLDPRGWSDCALAALSLPIVSFFYFQQLNAHLSACALCCWCFTVVLSHLWADYCSPLVLATLLGFMVILPSSRRLHPQISSLQSSPLVLKTAKTSSLSISYICWNAIYLFPNLHTLMTLSFPNPSWNILLQYISSVMPVL